LIKKLYKATLKCVNEAIHAGQYIVSCAVPKPLVNTGEFFFLACVREVVSSEMIF